MRILLTGASGFVGATLAPLLVEAGHALRCLLRPGSAAENLAGVPFERAAGALEDARALADAVRGCDAVVHLAALVSFRAQDRARMFAINETGTATLARLAREAGVARFLHVSSVSAVGLARRAEVLDETAPFNFGSWRIAYAESKHAAEARVRDEVARGLDAVIVNPASMIGPGDRRKAEGSLLDRVARGRVPFCPPGGVNLVDVRDVASGCVRALERGRTGERYILGGTNLTGRAMIEAIARAAGCRPPRWTLPAPLARGLGALATLVERVRPLPPPLTAQILRMTPLWFWYSSAKAERELGYRARGIDAALASAFAWLRNRGAAT
jgi:dihydroflavonol-4-reductase